MFELEKGTEKDIEKKEKRTKTNYNDRNIKQTIKVEECV